VVAIAVIVVASLATRGVAGAAVQSFGVSPSYGPPGTVVDVSGTACSPGITLTPEDHVTISSTVLPLPTNIPVAADGSWHGSFTVPGNATPGSGLILAGCVTDRLTLSPTTYTPHGFTVTANPPATTTTAGNRLPTTPTTARRTTITPAPTTRGPTDPGGTPTSGSTPGSTGGGNSGGGTGNGGSRRGAGGGGPGIGGSTGSTPGATRGAATSNAATAAGLRDPRLASSTSSRGGSGALWVLWLVLLLLAAGAGALLWWWQHREPGEADPVPDVT
jgi:hypothetical protein